MTTTSRARRLAVPVDSTRDHIQGPDDAPVTLVEYGDFECPFCGAAYHDIKEIRSRLGDRLRFVYRHFPRPEHPHARDAAEASECAAAQGPHHFWSMHDALFEHQDALDGDSLARYATAIGLDRDRFARDMASNVYLRHVQEDLRGAARSDVHGTPTFFINGARYTGFARPDGLYRELLRQVGEEATLDKIDQASQDSFPASDPPGWISVRL